jgi:porphobilinogen synthase
LDLDSKGFPQRDSAAYAAEPLRKLLRETSFDPSQLIYPLFVCIREGVRRPVSSMPGVFNLSVDEVLIEAEQAASLGGLIQVPKPIAKATVRPS